MNEEITLIYIGNGAFLPGIPARDLTKEEVKEHGGVVELVKTGLYVRPDKEEDKALPRRLGAPAGVFPLGEKPTQTKKASGDN